MNLRVPVRKMLKKDLVWLGENLCRHNHTFLEHYSCYLTEQPDTSPFKEKVGIFDIETTGLKANWSHMLAWCMKEHNKDVIHSDLITRNEARDKNDSRIIKSAVEEIRKYDRVVTYYGCLTPGHRVLTADLEWADVCCLLEGDKLLAFTDEPKYQQKRKWEVATVNGIHNDEKEVMSIELSDGTFLTATLDHPWFIPENVTHNKAIGYKWKKTHQLQIGDNFTRLLPVWDSPEMDDYSGYIKGYLAGFFDGEGTLSQSFSKNSYSKNGKRTFQIGASQGNPMLVGQVNDFLHQLGFNSSTRQYDKNHPHMSWIGILGGTEENLRFLGSVKPSRLHQKFNPELLGSIKNFNKREVTKIKSLKQLGKRPIIALGTTTGTYIAEGFGCHNSRFDIPYTRSRALYQKIDFPAYRDLYHTDLYYIARAKFAIHSNRLGVICEFFGIEAKNHPMTPDLWKRAGAGEKEALETILTHCEEDVESTDAVFNLLLEHMLIGKRSI